VRLDPEARNIRHTYVKAVEEGASWRVQQMLIDTEGLNDWAVEVGVDLAASRAAEVPMVELKSMGPIS
jgi:hypothetical protein